jgi:hypothetical protein
MLVRGGMKDHARPVRGKKIFQQRGIAGVTQHERRVWARSRAGQGLLQLVEMVFAGIEQNRARRSRLRQPKRQRGADGTASSGDEKRRIGEGGHGLRRGPRQRRPRQECAPVNAIRGRDHTSSINRGQVKISCANRALPRWPRCPNGIDLRLRILFCAAAWENCPCEYEDHAEGLTL